ncbi:TPA: N-acetyltransferase family protein [Streptococcus suis]
MLDFVPISPENWQVPLSVSPDQAESEFFIDSNYQRQGLGRQAMTQLLEKFSSERKFSAVQLCILSQNTPAKPKLYINHLALLKPANTMKMKLYYD